MTKKLIDRNTVIETVKKMGNACIIVGGEKEQIYGTLDFETMFIWTSKEKAEDFMKNNLDPNGDNKILEKPMQGLLELASNLGFSVVRFDFQDKEVHPEQAFVNYRLPKNRIFNFA